MNVLAIEYSSAQRSVAVVCSDAAGKPMVTAESIETGGRAANTIRMADEALREAEIEREMIDCVAVGLGPGSYTGIRTAISFAQGWELTGRIRVVGIPSTECIATDAQAAGISGRAGLVIDAQRGEFYLSEYEFAMDPDLGFREVSPLRIATAADVLELQKSGCPLFGPEPLKGVEGVQIVPSRAMTLGCLALGKKTFVSAENLTPVYLRQTTFVKAPKPRVL